VNYLELCQELVGQFGLSGGEGPQAIANNTGELLNVTRWIRDSTLYIDNLWEDWRYLWLRYSGTIQTGNSSGSPPTQSGVQVRLWESTGLKIQDGTIVSSSWTPLSFMRRQEFDAQFDPDVESQAQPSVFTVMPDNTLQFNCPADKVYNLKGAFYRRPAVLAADNDMPLIPSEYHNLIIARAVIKYGDREDAPELISGADAEYKDTLEKLEGSQLDGFRYRRRSTQPEESVAQRRESAYG
jgi:hypothetical protein